MQVKQRLRINAVVVVLSVIAVATVLALTTQHIIRDMEVNRIADRIITTAFERVTLRTDYLRTGSERAQEQVSAKHRQITGLLKTASEKFTDPEDKKIIDALIQGNESIGKNFRDIVQNRQITGAHGRSAALSREVEDRLLSQLNMRVYEAVVLAGRLQDSTHESLVSALRMAGGGIALAFLLAGALTLVNSWTMGRAITDRIHRLRDGAAAIGEGNLDHRIGLTGNDEFADLSKSFDAMTAKLQGSYLDLEKEVEERRRTEEALRKSEGMYRSLFDNMLNGFAYCRMLFESDRPADFIYLSVNRAFSTLTGLQDVEGKRVTEVIPGIRESDPLLFDIYGAVATTGVPMQFETYVGALKMWFSISVYSPAKEHFVAVFDVITERKKAEEALQESHAELEQRVQERTKELSELSEALERRVAERTGELESANTLLRNSRKAALNIMEDALGARRAAEESSIKLLREVEERKRAEEALRGNEAILKQAGQMANLGAWEISISNHDDLNANPLHWSDEVYRIFGYEPGEVSVSNNLFFERVHPDDRRLVMDAISQALATRTPYSIEHRITRHDGVERIVLEHAEISYDGQGRPVHIIGAVQDITEYKRVETELRRLTGDLEKKVSERTRFYSIRAKISDAIVRIHDRQSLFDEVCRVIVEEGSFRLAWVGILDPESRKVLPVSSFGARAYLEGIRIVAADVPEGKGPTGRAVYEDHYVINTDFEEDPRLLPWRDRARAHGLRSSSAFPLHTGGQVMGALTIYSDRPSFFTEEEVTLLLSLSQDISFALESMEIEKKRCVAEEALRVLNEELDLRVQKRTTELQEVNRELEAFIYSISHDLRAPVRTMAGFARFLAEDYGEKLDDQAKDYLRRINLGSEKMTLLINDLLRLSKISRQEFDRLDIDLSRLASSVISGLRASDPGRSVEVSVAEGLTAFADLRLMEIVLSNLLENAWKFTSKTENAQIEFGAHRHEGDTTYFVKDNGAGFNPEYMEKMFWPFQRLHTEEEFEGTGIGLTIVERIIHRHSGKVWAEGEVGKGATVYFTLGQNRV